MKHDLNLFVLTSGSGYFLECLSSDSQGCVAVVGVS